MEAYDIVMVVVLVATTVFGAFKGMAWQVASLSSLIVSYVVALKFRDTLAPLFGSEEPWNRFAAMLVLYLLTSLCIWLLFRLVAGFIDRVKLREFDRQLGAVLGFAKGILLCVAITFFAVTLSSNLRESILRSRSGYYIAVLIDKASGVMPEEVSDVIGPYLQRLDRELDPTTPSPGEPLPSGGNAAGAVAGDEPESVRR